MAYYVGDSIRIEVESNDWEGTPLTPASDAEVTITIFAKADDTVPVAETAMTWATSSANWYYDWDTEDVPAGAYRAVVSVAEDDSTSIEVKGIVLQEPDPVA